ncbi:MAG: PPC domain-containing DNA-binding protein [Fastidiosipilaceae bacterium]|jgi:predicted DNA-binding protein with PD1-like motif|nr:DNA-binding protein [Clostridiaceae bacterium]
MKYKKLGQTYVLRVDPGEDIVQSILKLADKEDIQVAEVTGIGAVSDVTIGVFDPLEKVYHSTELSDVFEITSLIGNLTRQGRQPYLHVHVNIASFDGKTYGGHLNKATVSATAEIIVRTFEGEIGRQFDNEIGLNLFKF